MRLTRELVSLVLEATLRRSLKVFARRHLDWRYHRRYGRIQYCYRLGWPSQLGRDMKFYLLFTPESARVGGAAIDVGVSNIVLDV